MVPLGGICDGNGYVLAAEEPFGSKHKVFWHLPKDLVVVSKNLGEI
jgi:hypothetical protein